MAELTYDENFQNFASRFETGKLYWLPRPARCSLVNISQDDGIRDMQARRHLLPVTMMANFMVECLVNIARRIGYYGCFAIKQWPEDQIDHINGDPSDNRIV